MANRSTFNSSLPRDIKRLIDLTGPLNTYEKRVPVKTTDTKGVEKTTFVIRKDYENEIRHLFLDAHKHHRRVHTEMLTKKTNENETSSESVESVSAS